MNFSRIEYFLAAAKYLNFTKAANVLYISQPSLSRQIALLEGELGMQLFDRSKRTLRLTAAGSFIYAEFNRLIPEMEGIIEKAKRMKNSEIETLRVGCVESISLGDAAAKVMTDFSSRARNIEMLIERCSIEVLHNKVMDGAVDVAFTLSTQIGRLRDIVCAVLERRRRYIIMSANHRLAERNEISVEDLRGETIVLYEMAEAMVSYDDIFEEFRKAGFFPKVRYAPNNNTILDYLEFGGCIALLDKSITESRPGKLKYYPTAMKKEFSLVCVWQKSNTNPALREFIKYLPEKPAE